jgi:dihydroxy-acid dehydratase
MIGLLEDGDVIEINIPARSVRAVLSDDEIARRRGNMEARGEQAWKPDRKRAVSPALQAYAALTTSAHRGAVRDVSQIGKRVR